MRIPKQTGNTAQLSTGSTTLRSSENRNLRATVLAPPEPEGPASMKAFEEDQVPRVQALGDRGQRLPILVAVGVSAGSRPGGRGWGAVAKA